MHDCSEKLFYTVIIDISMVVETVKILGIEEKLYIYIYIYILLPERFGIGLQRAAQPA